MIYKKKRTKKRNRILQFDKKKTKIFKEETKICKIKILRRRLK